MTPFLHAKGARDFVSELWSLLYEAQENGTGIPTSMIAAATEQIKKDKVSAWCECVSRLVVFCAVL